MDKHSESERKRVLVVDDSESILKLVDQQLRMEGFDVATVSNANDAVSWCDENGAPDLLLSDVSMPEVDGPTLHRMLDIRFPGMPVLFMSGGSDNSLAEIAWPLLDKPFTRDQLKAMINVSLLQAYVAKAVSD